MSKSRGFLFIGLAVLTIGLVYLISTIEWNMVEEEIGLSKEAEADPLLAARLFLKGHNKELATITSQDSFLKNGKIVLPKGSSLIVDEAALAEYDDIITALTAWVEQGGHLIYSLSPRREQLGLEDNEIITRADISIVDADNWVYRSSILDAPISNTVITNDEHSFSIHLAHRFLFENCGGLQITKKTSEEVLICEMGINNGYVTFLPSVNAISNDELRHLDHGEYLLWLIGTNNKLFYLPSTQSTSWALLLWEWSWQVVLLTLVLSLLLMWQLSMRLGVAIEPSEHSKNLFSKHIEAVGNFLFQYQHHDVLKNALMIDLANAVEKRHPKYKQLNLNEQADLISSLTGKNTNEIYLLLSEPLPEDDNQRIKFIKLFKELRNLL